MSAIDYISLGLVFCIQMGVVIYVLRTAEESAGRVVRKELQRWLAVVQDHRNENPSNE